MKTILKAIFLSVIITASSYAAVKTDCNFDRDCKVGQTCKANPLASRSAKFIGNCKNKKTLNLKYESLNKSDKKSDIVVPTSYPTKIFPIKKPVQTPIKANSKDNIIQPPKVGGMGIQLPNGACQSDANCCASCGYACDLTLPITVNGTTYPGTCNRPWRYSVPRRVANG